MDIMLTARDEEIDILKPKEFELLNF